MACFATQAMHTPFFFTAPRDASQPITERLEWLTDVQISRNGTETRKAIRSLPRYTYAYSILVTNPVSRACLEALRSETAFVVPLWCHSFEGNVTAPDAALSDTMQVLALDQQGGYTLEVPPVAWTGTYSLGAPAALARYAGNQRSFSYRTGKVSSGSVAFRLESFNEAVPAYAGPASSSMPDMFLLDRFTLTGSSIQEQIDDNANTSDNGLLDVYESRYIKRNYTVTVSLNSRAAILEFRALMFALRGRLNAFRWLAPGDTQEATWRLATDAVEIKYLRPGLASCTLSLTQLQ